MAKTTLQLRRGTQAENAVFTGALGEVTVDTTRKTLVVHDASTVGGSALATLASPAFTGSPTAPKATYGDNTTKLATTSFVHDAVAGIGAGPANTDSLTEGTTNLYFTKDRVKTALTAGGNISITQPGGAGTNVVINYTQPTNVSAFSNDAGYLTSASILNSLSVVSTPSGALQYNNVSGVFTFTQAVNSVNGLTGTIVLNTDNVAEGSTNKYATQSTVRGYLSAGTGITYTSGAISLTNTSISLGGKTISLTSGSNQAYTSDDVTEGSTNKYFSNTLARGAFSNGTGVTITNGQVAIGQAVATSDSVSFANVTATTNLTVNTSLLKTDASNARIGVNKATPAYTLDVGGDVNFSGALRVAGSAGATGYILQSTGASTAPTWASIEASLPENTELDRIRILRNAQSTWGSFINGTVLTVPDDANGNKGTGQFTQGMSLFGSIFNTTGVSASGAVQFSGSISGTTLTVSTTPVVGISSATTAITSGGTSGTNTFVVSNATGIQAGQLVLGAGVPAATYVISNYVAGTTTITLVNSAGAAQNFTSNGQGLYSFYTASGTAKIRPGMQVTNSSYQAGNVISTNTYITAQLTSNASPAATHTYVSGGAPGAYTMTISRPFTQIVIGQLVSGTGITAGTTVVNIANAVVTLSLPFTVQATGTYNFYTPGTDGTYSVNTSQTVSSADMTGGIATFSFNPNDSDADGVTPPYLVGQPVTVSNMVPSGYNGTYIVTACTATTISIGSTASGTQIFAGAIRAVITSDATITGANVAQLLNCTISGSTLTIGSVFSGTVSVGQALNGIGLSNLYIVSGSGLTWTLNRSTAGGSYAAITVTSYTVYPAQTLYSSIINGQSKTIDGGNTVFAPTSNGNLVSVTNPIQVIVVKNGLQLSPWLNNSGSVWQPLTPFGDYTVDSAGNIVFSTPPQISDTIFAEKLVGRSTNPVVKTYPFRAIDIMLGT